MMPWIYLSFCLTPLAAYSESIPTLSIKTPPQEIIHHASNTLEKGLKSRDIEENLIALYGLLISDYMPSTQILLSLLKKNHFVTQSYLLQVLQKNLSYSAEEILTQAGHSMFFPIRLQALYQLTQRQEANSLTKIQALRQKFHKTYHFIFTPLIAAHRSKESEEELKRILKEPSSHLRSSALLEIGNQHIHSLLPEVKKAFTHVNPIEKESAIFALSCYPDLKLYDLLKKETISTNDHLALASHLALWRLGFIDHKKEILALAQKNNPFALFLLHKMHEETPILVKALKNKDKTIWINALWGLLHHKDIRVLPELEKLLLIDPLDSVINIEHSPAHTMHHLIIESPSIINDADLEKELAITLHLQKLCLSLLSRYPEEEVLKFCKRLLSTNKHPFQRELIHTIENIKSEKSLDLLRSLSFSIGSPLKRGYALTALYRKSTHIKDQERFYKWLKSQSGDSIIKFSKTADPLSNLHVTPYELSPEEHTGLISEALLTASTSHEEKYLNLIIELFNTCHKKNRYALAGILMKAIQ